MTLRVYAVSGLNKYILCALSTFILAEVVFDVVAMGITLARGASSDYSFLLENPKISPRITKTPTRR
jgi:hypothetical protein